MVRMFQVTGMVRHLAVQPVGELLEIQRLKTRVLLLGPAVALLAQNVAVDLCAPSAVGVTPSDSPPMSTMIPLIPRLKLE